ncbi:DeoR family transcriptional regulator [Clostridium tyrobutyricum]|uniref:COG1349: Transcriptional regulators of sugar metabolism n=1 Tax=Clostridium tyrobutyricum DIVETGP TaxID=1408889 RepID=W6N4L5_CLOTY|nr:DeoR/GlpR family DNA-binding transcription regulator [Clostridium tyrobutyricum]AND84897.1 transcriptional regulator [Clostridium tyrobutyricum]ANP69471.1 transcriptional regulator [Clostridium tyrobutyricum]MBV4435363.1 DeoR/GlpR family DNA-binding transcription regulator [Clostridium tyrobutyricum]QNB66172.1 DeoR family transcriptional regulator [Clostridium tyrobutyricum]CDL90940.1 COG1349: Transcriptional regulators of sugar metabolism [Clostridium tyrobutyricum DIVETGP]
MFALERREKIYDYILKAKNVTVLELSKKLNVSEVTIRKDLSFLENQRLIDRTFGGAIIKSPIIKEESYFQKEKYMINEKHLIGEKAAEFIKPNTTIILDTGTTIMEMAKCIVNVKDLEVITTNLKIALFLSDFENIEVTLVGGKVSMKSKGCNGIETCKIIEKYNVDSCFLGCDAFDISKGFMTTNIEKMYLKRTFIKTSEKSFLLASSNKYGKRSMLKVCDLSELTGIIVDKQSQKLIDDFNESDLDSCVFV